MNDNKMKTNNKRLNNNKNRTNAKEQKKNQLAYSESGKIPKDGHTKE